MDLSRTMLLFCALALAACGGAPPSPVVGVVDLQRALNETQAGAAAREQLRGMFQQRQAELDRRGVQMRAEQAEIEAQAAQHVDVTARQAQYAAEFQALQAEYQSDQADLTTAEAEMTAQMIGRLETLVREISTAHGLDVVFERNEGGVVSVSSRTTDLTDELVRSYDQHFPIAAAPTTATTTAPQVVH